MSCNTVKLHYKNTLSVCTDTVWRPFSDSFWLLMLFHATVFVPRSFFKPGSFFPYYKSGNAAVNANTVCLNCWFKHSLFAWAKVVPGILGSWASELQYFFCWVLATTSSGPFWLSRAWPTFTLSKSLLNWQYDHTQTHRQTCRSGFKKKKWNCEDTERL